MPSPFADYDKHSLDLTHKAESAFAEATVRRALGFVASSSLRNVSSSEGSPIYEFVRSEDEGALRVLKTYFIYTTAGTYRDVFWNKYSSDGNWGSDLPVEGYCLRNGKEGGIIQLAALVERRRAKSGWPRHEIAGPIGTLLLFLHPKDHEEAYPEDQALIRAAIRNNTLMLTTIESARRWAKWENQVNPKTVHSEAPVKQPDTRSSEVVALIAHDRKKLELCRWAVRHRKQLSAFKSIVTTGTTGARVHEFLEAADVSADLIEPRFSGPEGGDIQIADLILREGCQHVVFFVDPTTAHPHESDIRALVRVCSLLDVKVNLRLTECAASSWINSYEPRRSS